MAFTIHKRVKIMTTFEKLAITDTPSNLWENFGRLDRFKIGSFWSQNVIRLQDSPQNKFHPFKILLARKLNEDDFDRRL